VPRRKAFVSDVQVMQQHQRSPRGLAQASPGELMRRVQANDVDAFGALYDRLAPKALGIARKLCADEQRAQEAVQEGFLSIWRARARYRPDRGEVHAWVNGLMRNAAIDNWRRNQRHDLRRDILEGQTEDIAAFGDVEADTLAMDDARRLRALIADLPLHQREVIALAYYGELSQVEISEQLTVPLGTIKGRMRLGLATLRAQVAL
jgi:RNA polymerase sigma-70 factor (ECF subfamily)